MSATQTQLNNVDIAAEPAKPSITVVGDQQQTGRTIPPFKYADLLDHGPYGDFRDALNEDGFVVIPRVMTEQRASEIRSKAFGWLESFGRGFDRNDPKTFGQKFLPQYGRGGMYPAHGIHHEQWVSELGWSEYLVGGADESYFVACATGVGLQARARGEGGIRQAVGDRQVGHLVRWWSDHDAISAAHERRRLVRKSNASCGTNVWTRLIRSLSPPPPPRQKWHHIDLNPSRVGFHCAQGIVNLNENGPDDGGLVVMKGSSKLMKQFFDETGRPPVPAGKIDTHGFKEEDKQWFFDRGCEWLKGKQTIHTSLDPATWC